MKKEEDFDDPSEKQSDSIHLEQIENDTIHNKCKEREKAAF